MPDDNGNRYEYYKELFEVTEWKDDADYKTVYKTKSMGHDWFPDILVDFNDPSKTNLIYAAASDKFSEENMCIRKVKSNDS